MAKNNKPRKRLTPDERARVIAMYKKGKRVVEIAEIIGIVPPTVSRIAQKAGLDSRMAVAIKSQGDRNQRIINQYVNEPDTPVDRIGAQFGITGQRVSVIIRKAGVPARPLAIQKKDTEQNADRKAAGREE